YRIKDEEVGLWEPGCLVIDPERAVTAFLGGARDAGAELRYGEPVLEWEATSSGVDVRTERGTYSADAIVMALGPWGHDFFTDLPVEVERQVTAVYATDQRIPCIQAPGVAGPDMSYAMQEGKGLIKAAVHHGGAVGHPDDLAFDVAPEEIDLITR